MFTTSILRNPQFLLDNRDILTKYCINLCYDTKAIDRNIYPAALWLWGVGIFLEENIVPGTYDFICKSLFPYYSESIKFREEYSAGYYKQLFQLKDEDYYSIDGLSAKCQITDNRSMNRYLIDRH